MTHALEGLRVVDFSRFLPGAYASWVAADMGADVVRIEHPRELAKQAAMFGKGADADAERRRRARPSYVRNKRSLLINPGHPEAHRVLHPLIARADVLIEDYRPRIMASMGLGYEALAAINPGLVYCSVSFAGQTGPLADRAGHDPAALALAGTLSRLNGLPTPTMPGLQVADVLTGAHTTIAMLLALQAKSRTGRGQHVDIAMSDASMSLLLVNLGRTDDPDALPELGKWHPKGGVWACADGGHLCTTDMEPRYWARFCDAIGRPDLGPRQHDAAHHPEMQRDIAAIIAARPRDEWVDLLAAADTQAQPILSMAEAIAHPHHRARGMVVDVPLPGSEPLTQLGLPFHLPDTPAVPPVAAGDPGAETDAILTELGLAAEAAALRSAGLFDDAKGAKA
jgi:crotonobetainyl-CoA:carnitine CoA-transferase CaiB-like acyl-CoA transferase